MRLGNFLKCATYRAWASVRSLETSGAGVREKGPGLLVGGTWLPAAFTHAEITRTVHGEMRVLLP
jgi:hypothetical protein